MYTLSMVGRALSGLSTAWLAADPPGRASLGGAFYRLRHRLRQDPLGLGESRGSPTERIAFGQGVAASFTVDPERRLVEVHRVWATRRRPA